MLSVDSSKFSYEQLNKNHFEIDLKAEVLVILGSTC